MSRIKVVAFGGGHGLAASLGALRGCAAELDLELTAVVTVGDDGGSSGRLRAQRGGLPPGDLRKALVALAGDRPLHRHSARLFEHRFAAAGVGPGPDALAGHAVGNLLLCGLMELLGDPVAALDHAAAMLGAVGRVLPMSRQPVGIEARVRGVDPLRPDEVSTVRGQHQVAVTPGHVESVRLTPAAPARLRRGGRRDRRGGLADLRPGSWYTSVLPHLLVPGLAAAIVTSPARRLVTLNLATDKETLGLSVADHLAALRWYLPELKVDLVLADGKVVGDPDTGAACGRIAGCPTPARPIAVADGSARHDPAALGAALVPVLGADR